ncbi:hypothetical protein [Falsirhodobacter sp. alg1]|uniref:hypothetical protein n=1 Tax=Falsirhodobacter sp. alg1 TaxID=1472418 RepID=UPI0005EF13F2|nr:hypothetical protein [Falsirhodobacter sp. alg1]
MLIRRNTSTALRRYARLECSGLWRESESAERREVVVFFRESSLILADPRSDQPLTHWSLPAVQRMNDGVPAIYGPGGGDEGETLEIEETAMIDALETVHGAIRAARPHPGRLRNALLGTGLILVVVAAFFVPGAIRSHTIEVVPQATRTKLGDLALTEMLHLTGAPCSAPLGRAATETLATRVFGAASVKIMVMRSGLTHPVHLPNRQILVPASLVEQQDGPEAVAGAALTEGMLSTLEDPLRPLLEYAGFFATLRLLTTGELPEGALDGYAEFLADSAAKGVSGDVLLSRFAAARIPLTPYLRSMGAGSDQTAALMAADPYRDGAKPPILTDNEWISLSNICR